MSNVLYIHTYIHTKYMVFKNILSIKFLNLSKLFLLLTFKWFKVLLCITNISIEHQPFLYAQLNDQSALFQTIQFNMGHLFAFSLNVKQFFLTHR